MNSQELYSDELTVLGLDDVVLIQIRPREFWDVELDRLSAQLKSVTTESTYQVVWLDLWRVRFINGSGLALIVRVWSHLHKTNRTLFLTGARQAVQETFSITKLDQVLPVGYEPFPQQTEGCLPEEQAFLQAIRTDPSDLAPRMAFADWLEEQADERAGLMRLLCHFAQVQKDRRGVHVPAIDDLLTRTAPQD